MKPLTCTCFFWAIALLACGPNDHSGTIQARLLVWNEATAEYAPRLVEVERLTSLRTLSGPNIEFRAFATIDIAANESSKGRLGVPFDFAWSQTQTGEVVPSDASSLAALTLYRNLDLAISEFHTHGWEPSLRLSVLVNPRYDHFWLGDTRGLNTDNAALGRSSTNAVFVALPAALTPGVPLSLNLGVTGHEIGHWVIADTTGFSKGPPEFNALHEGVADLFGFALTGDPDSFKASIDADRNLAQPKTYDAAQYQMLLSDKTQDPHLHGSYMARALYELWPRANTTFSKADRAALLRAVISTLRSYDPDRPAMAWFCGRLISSLTSDQRPPACDVLRARLAPLFEQIVECQ